MNDHGGAPAATDYESCLRQCPVCRIGYSNANHDNVGNLVRIYRDPFWNVPDFIANGHSTALQWAVNLGARGNKRSKFQSNNSEDHVTWTVFRSLQLGGMLQQVLAALDVIPAQLANCDPSLLLWGAPVPVEDNAAHQVHYRLIATLVGLGEALNRFSEPDVILDFGRHGLVFIEVKHRAGNETQPQDYPGWNTYLPDTEAFADPDATADSGLYELARNWRICWDVADDRPMTLINLGPPGLFEDNALDQFSQSLNQDQNHTFLPVSWADFLAGIPSIPAWLDAYLQGRGVV